MGLSRRMFTKEFKLAAVQRLERESSIGEVARAGSWSVKLTQNALPRMWPNRRLQPGCGRLLWLAPAHRWRKTVSDISKSGYAPDSGNHHKLGLRLLIVRL